MCSFSIPVLLARLLALSPSREHPAQQCRGLHHLEAYDRYTRKIGISVPAWKTAGARMLLDFCIRKPRINPWINATARKIGRLRLYWTWTWNEANMMAASRLEANGPRNLPYFFRKSPLNHNSSRRPLQSTRTRSAGVRARKREKVTPLFGKNEELSPNAARRKNTRKAMMLTRSHTQLLCLLRKRAFKLLPDAFVRRMIGRTRLSVPNT